MNAAEEVPKDTRTGRELGDALTTSLEYEAANADKSPGERFKFAEPAKKRSRRTSRTMVGTGSAAGTSVADISRRCES